MKGKGYFAVPAVTLLPCAFWSWKKHSVIASATLTRRHLCDNARRMLQLISDCVEQTVRGMQLTDGTPESFPLCSQARRLLAPTCVRKALRPHARVLQVILSATVQYLSWTYLWHLTACTLNKNKDFCGTCALPSTWSHYIPLHTKQSHNKMPPTWKHPVTSPLTCSTCKLLRHCWLMHPECTLQLQPNLKAKHCIPLGPLLFIQNLNHGET